MGLAADPATTVLLPTLPVVVARLVSFYSSEDHRIEDVVEILETDAPLSGRVLRLANSAYYGFSGRVSSLRHCLVLLGGATVQAVALGSTLLRAWGRGKLPPEVEGLWIHAYLSALGCRYLGTRLPRNGHSATADGLFLAGLFHDVGKILFLAQEPAQYARELQEADSSEDLRRRETSLFGQDHAAAGGELLASWHFPDRITALVRYHHSPGLRAEFRRDRAVLAAVAAALQEGEEQSGELPAALVGDLERHLEATRPQAEAFYRAIS